MSVASSSDVMLQPWNGSPPVWHRHHPQGHRGGHPGWHLQQRPPAGVGQGEGGIQPSLSLSIQRDTQSFLPVCNWCVQLSALGTGGSLSPAGTVPGAGTGQTGISLPGSEAAREKSMESEMGGWECDSGCVTPGQRCPDRRKSLLIHGLGSPVAFWGRGDPAVPPHSKEGSG